MGFLDTIKKFFGWHGVTTEFTRIEKQDATGEVTFKTRLTKGDIKRLEEGDPLAQKLAVLCDHWLVAQSERLGSNAPRVLLHDPLAVATLVEDDLSPFAETRIRIDDAGETHRVPDGALVAVAHDVDNDALRANMLETWLG